MHEPLGMAPVDGADNLGSPPHEILLEDLAVMWARLEDIPEVSALGIVHHEVHVGGRLEGTEEVRGPFRVCLERLQQDVPFELRRALLFMYI